MQFLKESLVRYLVEGFLKVQVYNITGDVGIPALIYTLDDIIARVTGTAELHWLKLHPWDTFHDLCGQEIQLS